MMKCEFEGIAKCNPGECNPYRCKAFRKQAQQEYEADCGRAKRVSYNIMHGYLKLRNEAERENDTKAASCIIQALRDEKAKLDDLVESYYNKRVEREEQYKYLPSSLKRGVMIGDKFIKMHSWSEVRMYKALECPKLKITYHEKIKVPGFARPYESDFKVEYNGSTIYVEVKADYWINEVQMAKINYLREHGYSIIMVDSNLIDKHFAL
jgi:hypothetical protein